MNEYGVAGRERAEKKRESSGGVWGLRRRSKARPRNENEKTDAANILQNHVKQGGGAKPLRRSDTSGHTSESTATANRMTTAATIFDDDDGNRNGPCT